MSKLEWTPTAPTNLVKKNLNLNLVYEWSALMQQTVKKIECSQIDSTTANNRTKMFFLGPSKDNLDAADFACFITQNTCGDALLAFAKSQRQWLDFYFGEQPIDLKEWTDTTQACCLTLLLSRLSQSNIRGKQKIMDRFASAVKNSDVKIFSRMLRCYSYANEEIIDFLKDFDREEHDVHNMNLCIYAEWARAELSKTPINKADQFDRYAPEEFKTMMNSMEYMLGSYFNYWK